MVQLYIIKKFLPIIKKYTLKLNYDGADSDLIIFLLKLIKIIPETLKDDCLLTSYISVAIKNEYLKLSKHNYKITTSEILLDEYTMEIPYTNEDEDLILINELLDKLNPEYKEVLKKIFIDGYSIATLAKKLNISRQALNKRKNIALEQLKNLIEI